MPLPSEFVFTCDGHGHSHKDEDHDGTLEMSLDYVRSKLVEDLAVITGHLRFSEDAIKGMSDDMDVEQDDAPIITLHITGADDDVRLWFLDRTQALTLSGQLLEWITRIDVDEEDEDG